MSLRADDIKGYTDPFSFRHADGTRDTLFFDRPVEALLVFPSKLVLPVWGDQSEFDASRIEEYRQHRLQTYHSIEVDSHIDRLSEPFIIGQNLYSADIWMVRQDQTVPFRGSDETEAAIQWLFGALDVLIDSADKLGSMDVLKAFKERLSPISTEITDFTKGDDQRKTNADHGLIWIKTGPSDDDPQALFVVPPSLMMITDIEIRFEHFAYKPEDDTVTPKVQAPLAEITITYDFEDGSSMVHQKDLCAEWYDTEEGSDRDPVHGKIRHYLEDKGISEGTGYIDALAHDTFFAVERDYSSQESAFENEQFVLWGSPFTYALDVIGYVPYPSEAVVAVSGIGKVSDVSYSFADRQVSALVDNVVLADFYANAAATLEGDMAEKVTKVSEGLGQLKRYFGGVFAPDPGLPMEANLENTYIASIDGASMSQIRGLEVADSRIDDQDGPMTLGVLEEINHKKVSKRSSLPGMALPIASFTRSIDTSTDLYWLYDASVPDFIPKDGSDSTVDLDVMQTAHGEGKDISIDLGADGSSDYQTYLSENTDADFESWVRSVNEDAADYSTLSTTPVRNKKIIGWDEYSRNFQTLFYMTPMSAGLDPSRMNSAEGRLLATANGVFEYSKIAAPHVYGLFGRVPKD